jgi:hypothetical protein
MKNQKIVFTGDQIKDDYQIIEYPFNNSIVKIKVDSNNRFVAIHEIIESKTFFNYKTGNISSKKSELENFYKVEQ